MNDILIKLDNLLEHKELVKLAGIRLGKKWINLGRAIEGRCLIERVYNHDSGKLYGSEFDNLNGVYENAIQLMNSIEHHRRTHDHHPEHPKYKKGIHDMPDVQLAEFCCDVWARCCLSGTSIREWMITEAPKRYNFTTEDYVYQRITWILDRLLDEPAKRIG
jgi:hypothetical protein